MEHKFKVGDKVKVHCLTGNRIGYIQERKSELRYDIRYDEGCIGHDIEENRIVKYNGNQDMEIKVGDKVRVSKDAPGIYMKTIFPNLVSSNMEVTEIGSGFARIKPLICEREYLTFEFAIPTKYLIKVEDEAKAKYRMGDRVYVLGSELLKRGVYTIIGVEHRERLGWYYQINIHEWHPEIDLEPYTEPTAPTIKVGDRVCCYNILHIKGSKKEDYMGYVASITDMGITIQLDKGGLVLVYHESELELVQPTEQTEKKPNIGSIKIPVEVDLTDSYWDTYTADLAKEIAVKLSKSNENKPGYVADYAASVAKAVVDNLKKK